MEEFGEQKKSNPVVTGVKFLVWLTLLGLSIYGIIYFSGKGSNDPNAKTYLGLSATYVASTAFGFVLLIILAMLFFMNKNK